MRPATTQAHNPHRYPEGPRPTGKSNGRGDTKLYLVTVMTTNFVEVDARDEDHARTLVGRRLLADFGGPMRSPSIESVEEVS